MALRILGLPGSVLGDPIRQVSFRRPRNEDGPARRWFSGLSWRFTSSPFRLLRFCLLQARYCSSYSSVQPGIRQQYSSRLWNLPGLSHLRPDYSHLRDISRFVKCLGVCDWEESCVSLGLWAAIDVAYVAALLWFLHASETRSTTCATPNSG